MKKPILGITMGDAAGVGPEIITKALAKREIYDIARPVVYGDLGMMERAALLGGTCEAGPVRGGWAVVAVLPRVGWAA